MAVTMSRVPDEIHLTFNRDPLLPRTRLPFLNAPGMGLGVSSRLTRLAYYVPVLLWTCILFCLLCRLSRILVLTEGSVTDRGVDLHRFFQC